MAMLAGFQSFLVVLSEIFHLKFQSITDLILTLNLIIILLTPLISSSH